MGAVGGPPGELPPPELAQRIRDIQHDLETLRAEQAELENVRRDTAGILTEQAQMERRLQALETGVPKNALRIKPRDGHHHMQPVRLLQSGTDKGFGFELDFQGGTVTRGSLFENRKFTIEMRGLGPFWFDYLVDVNWATEVSAGRGAEGDTFTTMTGFTFKVYSTLGGAVDDADANRQTSDQSSSFLIAPGTYSITSAMTPTPPANGQYYFQGAGQESSILSAGGGSIDFFSPPLHAGDAALLFRDIGFDSNSQSSVKFIDAGTGLEMAVEHCWFKVGTTGVGIEVDFDARFTKVRNCRFEGGATHVQVAGGADVLIEGNSFNNAGVGIQCGVSPVSSAQRLVVQGNGFDGCTTAIDISFTSPGSNMAIVGNEINVGTRGINFNAICRAITISGNSFVSLGNGNFGIDFDALGGAELCTGIVMTGNVFAGGDGTEVGIRGDTGLLNNSIAAHNVFWEILSGQEITNFTGAGNEAFHNISTDSTGVQRVLADIGLPVGHAASGTPVDDLLWKAATELTIATGAITATQSHHTIDTQSDAATDDLDTINGLVTNQLYFFRPANDARTVVLKHGTGNIEAAGNADIALDDAHDFAWAFSPDGSTIFVGANHSAAEITSIDRDTHVRVELGVNDHTIRFTVESVELMTISDHGVDIHLTADENNVHLLELEIDGAGFGDVKAINVSYVTGALATGEGSAVALLNIDALDATGGDLFGLLVLATETGANDVYGLGVGAGVGVIHQDSGTFVNPTTGTNNTPSTDVADMIDGSEGTNTTIFVADNDYIIIGAPAAFTAIEFNIETPASQPGIKPTFGYSVGADTFTTFSPIDGTNGFKNTGIVSWEPDELTGHIVNTTTGTFDIKITRTHAVAGSVSLFFAKTATTVVYTWDKDGVITAKSFVGTGLADSDGDTQVQVEESADEDKIRFDVAGAEVLVIEEDGSNDKATFGITVNRVNIGYDGGAASIVIGSHHTTPDPVLQTQSSRGTLASPTATQSGDQLGRWLFRGYGTSFANGGNLVAVATQTWTASAHGSKFEMFTTPDGSTTPTLGLRLTQAGQVELPIQGSAGGLLIGTDVQVYRSAANTILLDSGSANGTMSIGAVKQSFGTAIVELEFLASAAVNLTNLFGTNIVQFADATNTDGLPSTGIVQFATGVLNVFEDIDIADHIAVGASASIDSRVGAVLVLAETATATASARLAQMEIALTYTPAAISSTPFRGLFMNVQAGGDEDVDGFLAGAGALQFVCQHNSSGDINNLSGAAGQTIMGANPLDGVSTKTPTLTELGSTGVGVNATFIIAAYDGWSSGAVTLQAGVGNTGVKALGASLILRTFQDAGNTITIADAYGVRAEIDMRDHSGSELNRITATNVSGLFVRNRGVATNAIATTLAGLRIENMNVGAGTYTNGPYGIIQEGTGDVNHLFGFTYIGESSLVSLAVANNSVLTVDQEATGGAIPVLTLDQADVSEEMIEFITTIGTGNAIEAIGAKTLTTTHFIKVTIPGGLTRYFPVGTIA